MRDPKLSQCDPTEKEKIEDTSGKKDRALFIFSHLPPGILTVIFLASFPASFNNGKAFQRSNFASSSVLP
uniref:Uncharacterized protein n=1 Tax=Nelumbo nucifera TaxID=4432 RepID=A0A822XK10_NELNU|nr:TPA_asm: hypothetical protein HUJ06_020882 [Nelumbo nucifera]